MGLNPLDLLHITWLSLTGNPLRSGLTALGVFMGVAAVNATLQVGAISQTEIARQISEREAPQVRIYGLWGQGGFQPQDIAFLRQRLKTAQAISHAEWPDLGSYEISWQSQVVDRLQIMVVSPGYLETIGRKVLTGRPFNTQDYETFRQVVLIDTLLKEQLFGTRPAVGEQIILDNRNYRVIGVVESKTSAYGEPRGLLMMTSAYYSALTGRQNVFMLAIRPRHLDDINFLQDQAEALLKQRYGKEQEFYLGSNIEDLLERRSLLQQVSIALSVLGIISLIVGGIGIANITIAAVTERTAEIGLRRAIGATQRDIMLQFILEATLVSLVGGAAAIGLVHGLTVVVSEQFKLPYQFNWQTTSLALGSAFGVGIGASFFPALRASQLDPVKALRSS